MKFLIGSIVSAAIVLTGISACSDDQSKKPEKEPDVKVTASPRALRDITLPLDAYELTVEQRQRLEDAQNLLVRDCLKRFGISYRSSAPRFPPQWDIQATRYVFVDPALAARGGFNQGKPKLRESGPSRDELNLPGLTRDERLIVMGGGIPAMKNGKVTVTRVTSFRGVSVPEGGCGGEAQKTLIQGADWKIEPEEDIMIPIRGEVRGRVGSDSRVTALNARWSTCMKKSGYDYRKPEDAWNQDWPSFRENTGADQKEIQTALAYGKCQSEVNYLGVMSAVQEAYEHEIIEKNEERLLQVRRSYDLKLDNATKILEG